MSEGAADARSIRGKYTIVEHTADIGIEVKSKTLAGLFALTGCAMFDLMVDLSGVRPRHVAEVSLQAGSHEELMVTWLNELIFRSEISGMFFSKFEVESVDGGQLKAAIWGEPYDEGTHAVDHSIKAATYHELDVSRTRRGWSARIIFDV